MQPSCGVEIAALLFLNGATIGSFNLTVVMLPPRSTNVPSPETASVPHSAAAGAPSTGAPPASAGRVTWEGSIAIDSALWEMKGGAVERGLQNLRSALARFCPTLADLRESLGLGIIFGGHRALSLFAEAVDVSECGRTLPQDKAESLISLATECKDINSLRILVDQYGMANLATPYTPRPYTMYRLQEWGDPQAMALYNAAFGVTEADMRAGARAFEEHRKGQLGLSPVKVVKSPITMFRWW